MFDIQVCNVVTWCDTPCGHILDLEIGHGLLAIDSNIGQLFLQQKSCSENCQFKDNLTETSFDIGHFRIAITLFYNLIIKTVNCFRIMFFAFVNILIFQKIFVGSTT